MIWVKYKRMPRMFCIPVGIKEQTMVIARTSRLQNRDNHKVTILTVKFLKGSSHHTKYSVNLYGRMGNGARRNLSAYLRGVVEVRFVG